MMMQGACILVEAMYGWVSYPTSHQHEGIQCMIFLQSWIYRWHEAAHRWIYLGAHTYGLSDGGCWDGVSEEENVFRVVEYVRSMS